MLFGISDLFCEVGLSIYIHFRRFYSYFAVSRIIFLTVRLRKCVEPL